METPERVHHSLAGHSILLIEDSEDDVFMMQRAFRKANIPNPLQVATNGAEGLDYLEGRGAFADRTKFPVPIIVFLDLNLPKKSGFEVLEYARQQPVLKMLTIYILSSSTRPSDVERAAQLGANGYFIKPTQIEKLQELVQAWFNLSRFKAYPGLGTIA
jgi:CheY-like chemotaxis protein